MSDDMRRGTAAIHRFPPGGRASLARPAKPPAAPVPTVSFGSGWYHEAAIKAAKDNNVRPLR